METKAFDKWIVSTIEDNVLTIVVAFAVVTLAQLLWWSMRTPKALLTESGFHDLKLIMRKDVSHNSRFFRFALKNKRQQLGLPVGQHLVFRMTPRSGEEPVSRPYTPVSDRTTTGYVDFVIKIYPEGVMTQYLEQLKVGQTMPMKGPKGKFTYVPNMKKSLGMLAGGTGITPMYQVLNHILQDPNDTTAIYLIYANITPADILLRQDLDGLAAKHPQRLKIYYVIEKSVPVGWKYGVGYITRDMICEHCPAPGPDVLILFCGPRPMVEAMKQLTAEIGYAPESTFKF